MTNISQQIDDLTSDMVIESKARNEKYKPDFDAYKENLRNTPEARNKDIMRDWVLTMATLDAKFDGDEESALKYWVEIANRAAEKTLTEIDTIPYPERGGKWADTRAFLVAVTWWQSYIDVYVKADAIAGVTNGLKVKDLLKGVDVREITKGMNLNKAVKAKGTK